MTIKQIYIARHGYRANWLPPPHPPNPTGIDSDPPLAPHGVDQAKQLAAYITSLPTADKPQYILTSPFYRCVETAHPIAEMLDLDIAIERGCGQFFPKLTTKEVWHRDDTVGVVPDLSGETEEDIFNRCKLFWSKFIPVFESKYPEYENVLIVSHAATKIALGMSLLGFDDVFQQIDNDGTYLRAGACSIDKYVKDGDRWDLRMNGNCEFLTDGEEMNWTFHSAFEAGSDEDIKARKEEAERKEAEKKAKEKEPTPVTETAAGTDEESKGNSNIEYELSIVDNQIYQTNWARLVGTDLIFDEYGELIGKVNEHLVGDPNVKINAKAEKDKTPDSPQGKQEGFAQTAFFRKAMKAVSTKNQSKTPDVDVEMS
ncbi:hypothetical protein QCA50_017219 [Cerrena zonata]|uniref:Transcription factor TFIIIC, tau55 subunit n=1 Tax=Cerrena zonata TaxID=2478898 RepID=A0AAW0FSP0_9APHY